VPGKKVGVSSLRKRTKGDLLVSDHIGRFSLTDSRKRNAIGERKKFQPLKEPKEKKSRRKQVVFFQEKEK